MGRRFNTYHDDFFEDYHPRRRRYSRREEINPIAALITLSMIGLVYLGYKNQTTLIPLLSYVLAGSLMLVVGIVAWSRCKSLLLKWHDNSIIEFARQNNLESVINNFIDTIHHNNKKPDWTYLGHGYDWDQLHILRDVLNEKGMGLGTRDYKELALLLRHYIQKKEELFIRNSVAPTSTLQYFADLTGTQFENLLCRLYEAMNYSVKQTGKTGDQGADLLVNMGQNKVLIQAKCYTNRTVGNSAVQEAVAAMKFYGCNKAMVVTSSTFTREAVELAKANNIDLVDRKQLSELLCKYLHENWA